MLPFRHFPLSFLLLLAFTATIRPCAAQPSAESISPPIQPPASLVYSSSAPSTAAAADAPSTPSALPVLQHPPDRFRLALDGVGAFSVVLVEEAPSAEVHENALQRFNHKQKNLPGPPPPEIERYRVVWGLLEDGTCLYSYAPTSNTLTGCGAPYVRGNLAPDDLAAVRERVQLLLDTGRNRALRYPWIVCTMGITTVRLQVTLDSLTVSAQLPGPDFHSALESRPRYFPLKPEHEAYRQGFAELVRLLSARRSSSFEEIGPAPGRIIASPAFPSDV